MTAANITPPQNPVDAASQAVDQAQAYLKQVQEYASKVDERANQIKKSQKERDKREVLINRGIVGAGISATVWATTKAFLTSSPENKIIAPIANAPQQPLPTLAAIKSFDPINNTDAFVAAANAATPDVKIQVIQDVSSVITTKNNLAHDFAGMAQPQSLYGTAGKVVDTRFIAQLQNFGGSAATEATNTNAAPLLDMFKFQPNIDHFKSLASGDAMLLNTLNNLPQDPQQLNAIVAQLSDLEYTRLKSLSGVDFHQHFEEAFNAGGATSMKQAVAQLKDTFKGYGEKFTEQVRALQETLQKISPRSSAVSDSDGVLVASVGDLSGLGISFPSTPTPPNALQQTFSFLQGKAHESLEAMGSAAKATGEFVRNHASEFTAASAAVTLVRAHIETTQMGLDAKATRRERAVAALTTNVSVQEYANTLSQSRYALGLARTVALAAVAITPAAMGVAATIGTAQLLQTGAGITAALTQRSIKRLEALQQKEGLSEQGRVKLETRQTDLQNRAAYFEKIAIANWQDVAAVGAETAQNIVNVKVSMFKQALKVTDCVQQAAKPVQNFINNFAARLSKTAELA